MLLSAILAPLLVVPVLAIIKSWKEEALVVALSLLASTLLLITSYRRPSLEIYPIELALGLLVLEGNGFNVICSLLASLLCFATALHSLSYMDRFFRKNRPEVFYTLYSAASSTLIAIPLSGSLTTFFLFFESYLIATWLLMVIFGGPKAGEVATKYVVFTETGALATMLGIAILYDKYRVLDFNHLKLFLERESPANLVTVFSLLVAGPLMKMAVVPLHVWLPDAYTEVPVPVSALVNIAEGVSGWAIARTIILTGAGVLDVGNAGTAVALLSIVTIVYGGLAALAQKDLRNLLAYSTISHSGYLLLGILSGGETTIASVTLFLSSFSIAKIVLLMVSGLLESTVEHDSVEGLGGLASFMPVTSISTFIAFLCLSGIPPTMGFWLEFTVLTGIASLKVKEGILGLAAVAALSTLTVLTAAYCLWWFKRAFFGTPKKTVKEEIGISTLVPFILALLIIVLGVFPTLILEPVAQLGRG
ncbi:MAG: complex I subunit 5 family protein [Thermofilaceae archaeon]|nr:complex I subunit 5 family protein [Thermofilaceae archaeon]